MMFPPQVKGWTLAEVDALDVHFFTELMNMNEVEKEQYLSDLW